MSHTVKIKVEFRDEKSLGAAVLALGGSILGVGEHWLYGGAVTGLGFRLPGWCYPLVLVGAMGELSFDDYGGSWGNRADIDRLRGEYALAVAEGVAQAQGWYCERSQGDLIIYHPDGGVLRVSSEGVVDTSGFTGASCAIASEPIETALGRVELESRKVEFYHEVAGIKIKGV
jgi:hypothetical protein